MSETCRGCLNSCSDDFKIEEQYDEMYTAVVGIRVSIDMKIIYLYFSFNSFIFFRYLQLKQYPT